VGLTNVGNQARPLKYSEQICICSHSRAHALMHGHQPQHITNIDEAEIVMCAQNCQASTGSYFLNDRGNNIFFKINPHRRKSIGV